ncbi:MAG: serine hydrolase domain-containing protein [Chitinophagaceae bacterium]
MKKPILFSLLCVIFLACNHSSGEQDPEEDSLQYYPPTPEALNQAEFRLLYRNLSAFFDSTLLRGGFNGGILVARNGSVIYEKYAGRTDLRKNDTLSASTPIHIASTSKTFTALAVLRLIQEGKLNITDTLNRFFPGFPYPGITVEMLLTHRSGLPNYLYFMSNLKWGIGEDGKWNRQLATNEDMLRMLTEKKPDLTGTPGRRFNYCNTNYVLLALIIEHVTGKTYPDYMQQKWFIPLGMNHTYVFTRKDTATATPSFNASGTYWAFDFLDGTYGDKNIYSTPQDLLKWDQALYSGQLIRPSLLDSAFSPWSNEKPSMHNYGYGWRMQLFPNGNKIVYHFGKWHGFNSAFARLTDVKATIIILGNRFTRSIYHAAHHCYDIFGDYGQEPDSEAEESDPAHSQVSPTPFIKKKRP